MRTLTSALGTALVVAAASAASAQTTSRASIAPTSKLWIEGTSNVHDWKCDAKTVDASIDIEGLGAQLPTALSKALKKVSVRIPVKSLKCGHDKMDDNLYKALNADQNAEILYTLTTFEAVAGEGTAFTLKTTGKLTINGTENAIAMDVVALRMPDGTVKATGTVPVKMTAFGVKPPKAMMGAIKTGDEVKVKFELVVGPRIIAALPDK